MSNIYKREILICALKETLYNIILGIKRIMTLAGKLLYSKNHNLSDYDICHIVETCRNLSCLSSEMPTRIYAEK